VKLLLDANLSPEVARLLKKAGHDAIHVRDIGLLSASDPEILQACGVRKPAFESGSSRRSAQAAAQVNAVVLGRSESAIPDEPARRSRSFWSRVLIFATAMTPPGDAGRVGGMLLVDSRDIPSPKPDRVRQRRGTGPLPTAALTPAT
jgi:Domain of unknown function (DUF5615)